MYGRTLKVGALMQEQPLKTQSQRINTEVCQGIPLLFTNKKLSAPLSWLFLKGHSMTGKHLILFQNDISQLRHSKKHKRNIKIWWNKHDKIFCSILNVVNQMHENIGFWPSFFFKLSVWTSIYSLEKLGWSWFIWTGCIKHWTLST